MEQNLQNVQLPVSIMENNAHLLPHKQEWSGEYDRPYILLGSLTEE